jgi:hypothetical protein
VLSFVKLIEGVGITVGFVGKITLEKVVNAVGEDVGVALFSEETNFGGIEREGSVNKESAEIS